MLLTAHSHIYISGYLERAAIIVGIFIESKLVVALLLGAFAVIFGAAISIRWNAMRA